MTFNANGIRSAARKGFFGWLREQNPDVLAMQETKAQEHQLPPEALDLDAYRRYVFVDAQKRGYSGVALYAKIEPDNVVRGFGRGFEDMDAEGRFARFDWGDFSIASVYVPSGTSGEVRQAVKDSFLERFVELLASYANDGRRYILCGDFNIAHREIDTYDPVRNALVTGHLPHERAWMEAALEEIGWVDAFRVVDHEPKRYTWWSGWPGAWERNLGWRIDYQLVTPNVAPFVRSAVIERNARFSDHAPLTLTYDLTLA
ncbi:MAG TPA: exodeoxyribonuclease III [Candidatus Baltobacteraceae bacterium]|nr:exodeoxyribonuclease III [Candidatus Baltobacteraceae bacterium]